MFIVQQRFERMLVDLQQHFFEKKHPSNGNICRIWVSNSEYLLCLKESRFPTIFVSPTSPQPVSQLVFHVQVTGERSEVSLMGMKAADWRTWRLVMLPKASGKLTHQESTRTVWQMMEVTEALEKSWRQLNMTRWKMWSFLWRKTKDVKNWLSIASSWLWRVIRCYRVSWTYRSKTKHAWLHRL